MKFQTQHTNAAPNSRRGLVAAFAVAALLGACTSSKVEVSIGPDGLPVAPALLTPTSVVNDLTLGACPGKAGEHTLTGSFKATANKAQDYVLAVTWTDDKNAVKGRAVQIFADVSPGSSESFELSAKVGEGATRCIPALTAGTLPTH